MNPLVKWAGGKRKLLPELVANMPAVYGRYIEPFFGGGALFFHLEPTGAILGDYNEKLICMYLTVREYAEDVGKVLQILADEYSPNNKEYYLAVRRAFNSNHLFTPLAFSAQFLFLNRTCFNGLWRVNRSGGFNVPMGSYKNPSFPSVEDIVRTGELLEHSSIRAAHFQTTLQLAREDDFVYCDPPYHGTYGSYTEDGFTEEDQVMLSATLEMLDRRGVRWMVSNSDTPLIRKLYEPYNIIEVQAARAINSDGSGRGKITELIIKNYGGA